MALSVLGCCHESGLHAPPPRQRLRQGHPIRIFQVPAARQSETVIRNVFDGLVTRDIRTDAHMELAEEMNWLDEQTLEIRLRRGVLFHDDTEKTADDVVFTFERII